MCGCMYAVWLSTCDDCVWGVSVCGGVGGAWGGVCGDVWVGVGWCLWVGGCGCVHLCVGVYVEYACTYVCIRVLDTWVSKDYTWHAVRMCQGMQ